MDDIFVGSLMSSPVRTVTPDTSLRDAGEQMLADGIGSVIVVDGEGRLAGILTSTDFVRIVAESGTDADATVGDFMSTDVTTATANDSIRDVADMMVDHGFHHVPVVGGDDEVIGVITTTDLTAYVSTVQDPSPA
ncbi:MAG: CBS domain-containing protein [Haloferacaceae archaeon]